MIFKQRNITVRQLPATLDARGRKVFSRLLEVCLNVERPLLVFDCSQLSDLDPSAIHFLLCCLEEAMKRNGDVRLAALAPNASARFEMAGADRIFETFHTIADAVDSYRQPCIGVAPATSILESAVQAA
jgi:anti-sigma B factor antagonist